MDETVTTTPKRTSRTRKTAPILTVSDQQDLQTANTIPVASHTQITQNFDELVTKLIQTKGEYDNLQKEIAQIKADWAREQKQHELELVQQKTQENWKGKESKKLINIIQL